MKIALGKNNLCRYSRKNDLEKGRCFVSFFAQSKNEKISFTSIYI